MSEEEKPSDSITTESTEEFIPWNTFLEEYPVMSNQRVSGYYTKESGYGVELALIKTTPVLKLFCAECYVLRNFDGEWTIYSRLRQSSSLNDFLVYLCRDCKKGMKHYSLISSYIDADGNGQALKVGEYPELSIKIPSSLPKLLGKDYPYFIKGLKCEKQGLGVAAYAYYRRVVENQKNRLLKEILKVSAKLGADEAITNNLEAAIKEVQFSKAIDIAKESMPESLLIDGHNPFKLLHRVLSIGIHNQPDESCLEIAHNIRIVLTDLSVRIKAALGERNDLKASVASLLKFNKDKK